VGFDHRPLDRVQVAVFSQSFDGNDMRAVELIQELDAGIDWSVPERIAGGPADEHGASAAIAFGANHLGADQPELPAQVIGERLECGLTADGLETAIQVKAKVVAHHNGDEPLLAVAIESWYT
jgi:hypothetical protein